MASPLQQPSFRRKLVYFALILVLFTGAWLFRTQVVEARANDLGLREQSLGEVELTGAAVRLSLTGSRGLVICSLWVAADQHQKRRELNKLELVVDSITKLQPQFSSVWLYQSWNMAYNIPAELEEGKDQYFYIARGLQILNEGVQRLQNNPDLRLRLGEYYEHKIGLSDDSKILQSLFQLSCIDPRERDPRRFRKPDGQIDLDQFEQFCRAHPQLARRLREKRMQEGNRVWMKPRSAAEVVAFLEKSFKIPSRYEDVTADGKLKLKPANAQFPILPPHFDPREPSPDDHLDDRFDCYQAARAWLSYAQLPLPPASPVPGPRSADYDRRQYRMPRINPYLFRARPARAQMYVAERLQQEGWFDEGWPVDEGRETLNQWFPDRSVAIGGGRNWSREAWQQAHERWKQYGELTGLRELDPEERRRLNEQAERYRSAYGVRPNEPGPDLRPDLRAGGMGESFDAHRHLYWYDYWRDLEQTNFPRFFHQTRVEMMPDAIEARKRFYQADELRKRGEPAEVILPVVEQAFAKWRPILLKNPEFRRIVTVQDETYERQLAYQQLVQELHGTELKQLLVLQDFLAQAAFRPAGVTLWLPPAQLLPRRILPAFLVRGPFDNMVDENGQPLVSAETIHRWRSRMGLADE